MSEIYDIIIIGAGPAGLAAGIYAPRRNLKTLLLSKDLGGQANTTPSIENYPGFKQIDGFELMQKFEEQVKLFGTEVKYEEVEEIKEKDKNFIVSTINDKYKTKTVILAFGKTPKSLGIAGEKEYSGKGVYYCVTCDGPLFRGKITAVVGGGNSALEAALILSDICKKVYLIHRRQEFRGFEHYIERVKARKNVELILSTVVKEFRGGKFLEYIKVEDVNTKEKKKIDVNGVFIEIGSEVKTDFVKGLVKLDDQNHVVVNQMCETYYPNSDKIRHGVFAAGDVTNVPFRQIVISAGAGAKAALQAYNYIHGIEPQFIADWTKKLKG